MNKVVAIVLVSMVLVACNRETAVPATQASSSGAAAQAPAAVPVEVLALVPTSESFDTQTGRLAGDQLVNDGKDGYLLYGPYAAVQAGTYAVIVDGRVEQAPRGSRTMLDIASGKGKVVHAALAVEAAGNIPVLDFTLPQPVDNLEVRIRTVGGAHVAVRSYKMVRKN